jgi:hypothetical protein
MKYKNFFYTSAIVMSTLLTFSVGKATAQTTANGPYYAWPSWDQQLPASTRFIVLSNWKDADFPSGGAAVLDRETGLVWQRSSTLHSNWSDAQSNCNGNKTGGRMGWRLPTLQELASLVDRAQSNPTLPSGHPFQNVQSSFYWSATTNAALGAGFAWGVSFDVGGVNVLTKSVQNFVWCVRGGQGVDPQ